MGGVGCVAEVPSALAMREGGWGDRPGFLFSGYFAYFVVLDCWVAVWEGSDSVFREPCSLPCDFEGDGKYGGVFIFRAHASEVFWCEATVNVLAEMFRCDVVCFDLVYVVYSFV